MRHRRLGACAALAAVLAVAGCGAGDDDRAVPDEVLLAQIARLPGVTAVDVSYEGGTLNVGPGYTGSVTVDDTTDPSCLLDRVYAILWQGRVASLEVYLLRGGDDLTSDELLGFDANVHDPQVERRYGPRTGTTEFVEPEAPPACR